MNNAKTNETLEVVEYTVESSKTLEELIEKVQDRIDEGWQPLGGVSACKAENDDYVNEVYAQALVKYG